jgi:hypothetical protein
MAATVVGEIVSQSVGGIADMSQMFVRIHVSNPEIRV